MKLIFIASYVTNKGGMMQSLLSMVKGLSSDSFFELVVITPCNSELSKCVFNERVEVLTTPSTKWATSKSNLVGSFKSAYEIWKLIKNMIPTSYIICNDLTASILVSFMPCFNYHEIFISRGGNYRGAGLGGWFMRHKLRYNRVVKAVATCTKQQLLIVENGFPKEKTKIIFNGLPLPSVSFKFTPIDKKKVTLGVLGFISDGKNQIVGVRLVKMLRDKGVNAVLNIYGTPFTESDKLYLLKLNGEIDRLGVKDYIKFKGFVADESKYKESDIVISFSKSEGFGRTLVEGMLRKKPIIAFRGAGGPIDITQDGKYGYLVRENVESAYFDVIMDILNNPMDVEQNVQNAYEFAVRTFTEDIMVNNYVVFFKTLPALC